MKRGPSVLVGVIVVALAGFFVGASSKAVSFKHQVSTPLCSYEELAKAVSATDILDWRIVAVPAVQTTKGTCLVIVAEK
jgi:hypothetical protein